MSRWRDVKQGRKNETVRKEKSLPDFTISPILDRFKAFITDTFMILMPIMYFVFYIVMGSREEFSEHMLQGWFYIFIPHFIIVILFYMYKGQTPGYKQYGIKIVTSTLEKPTFLQLSLRYILFGLSFFFPAGLLFCFMRKDKKNMHDILSSTIPIHIEK